MRYLSTIGVGCLLVVTACGARAVDERKGVNERERADEQQANEPLAPGDPEPEVTSSEEPDEDASPRNPTESDSGARPSVLQPGSPEPDSSPLAPSIPPNPSSPVVEQPSSPAVGQDAGASASPVNTGSDVYASEDSSCWFEFLGNGIRCVDFDAEHDTEHETLSACASTCLASDDCTSISDYTYFDTGSTCRTRSQQCAPGTGVAYEEDGAREYRKVCGDHPPEGAIVEFSDAPGFPASVGSDCRFVPIVDFTSCEGTVPADEASLTFDTLEECTAACESNPECSAVQDWWYGGPSEFECALHLGTCDEPFEHEYDGSDFRFFKKTCL